MSVLAKARSYERGFPLVHVRHLHAVPGARRRLHPALLNGYEDKPPAGFTLPPGSYYNKYFPGHAHRACRRR